MAMIIAMTMEMTMAMAVSRARLSKLLVGGFSLQRPEPLQEHELCGTAQYNELYRIQCRKLLKYFLDSLDSANSLSQD